MSTLDAPGWTAQTPIEILDRALLLVRRAPLGRLARAWFSALPLSAAVLLLYDFERVEGVRELRAVLSFLLVLGFAYRSAALSQLARTFALQLRPALPVTETASTFVQLVPTVAVVGAGLWLWLWPLGLAAKVSPFAAALVFPLLSARGSVAPSWLARASCAPERGFAALGRALDDNAGVRGVMASVELLLILGNLCLIANLYALLALGLSVTNSLLGLQTAFVSAFLSPDNEVVPLAIATLALVLFEPLRAAVSACAFADARSRRDGADLHAAIDHVIEATAPATTASAAKKSLGAVAALLLCLASAIAPAHVSAQPSAAHDRVAQHDAEVRTRVQRILRQSEFGEVAETDAHGFWQWLTDQLKKLFDDKPDHEKSKDDSFRIDFPKISPWVVMLVALLLLLLVIWQVRGDLSRAAHKRSTTARESTALHPNEQEPQQLLDDAARLAEQGRFREALRSLYVATLAALDRAHLIRFAPDKTNGQYLRSMPASDLRKLFGAFTRVFDHTWYGRQPASRDDYEHCRELAARICSVEEQP